MRIIAAVAVVLCVALPAAADISGYAIVQDDATLKVAGRHVRLHGVFVPPTEVTCETRLRPVECKSRAALALDFRIQSFVRCSEVQAYSDNSVAAICTVPGDSITSPRIDLGGWLISQGWAVAGPYAPFDYVTRERIARHRGMGVWGFQADRVFVR